MKIQSSSFLRKKAVSEAEKLLSSKEDFIEISGIKSKGFFLSKKKVDSMLLIEEIVFNGNNLFILQKK